MLLRDSSYTAAALFRDFKEKGLYAALQAEGSAVLAMSGRCKVEIKGVDAWNGLDVRLCESLCHSHRERIWAVPGVQGLTDPASGVHMAVVCLHTQERFKAFTIFFRRSQPRKSCFPHGGQNTARRLGPGRQTGGKQSQPTAKWVFVSWQIPPANMQMICIL